MRDAFIDTDDRAAGRGPAHRLVLADISAAAFAPAAPRAPRPGAQRRHPRAADDRRGRRAGADRAAADRALVRAVPGRAGVRADQAGPRPPGRRRGAGQRRRVLRRLDRGPHPHVTGRRRAARHPATAGPCTCPATPTRWRRCCARGRAARRPGVPAAVHAGQRTGRTPTTRRLRPLRRGHGRAAGGRGRPDARPGAGGDRRAWT